MEVEILVVPGCANEEPARRLVEQAFETLGIDGSFLVTVIADEQQAQARAFSGSPTFMVDGADLFADSGGQVAMACRLYRVDGMAMGTPSMDDMIAALQRAQSPADDV